MILSLCLLAALAGAAGARAADAPAAGRWSLGVVNHGGAVNYQASRKVALEAKALFSSGVYIAGPRLYYYFNPGSRLSLFCGAEGDYIGFKGKVSRGSGFAGGAFVGGSVGMGSRFGLAMDFGPMYIGLKDKSSSLGVGGIDYVLNMGIYWHF